MALDLNTVFSFISLVISLLSLLIIILVQLWNIRLRGIEYQIERYNLLLEQCFGPLLNYFRQAVVYRDYFNIFAGEQKIPSSKIYLHFRAGLLEKIERIWDRYNFEIKRLNPKLGKNIQHIISMAQGRRSKKNQVEKHYVTFDDLPKRFLPSEKCDNDNEIESEARKRIIEQVFENWKKEIIMQITQTTDLIAERLAKDLALRENRKQILCHLFWSYSNK